MITFTTPKTLDNGATIGVAQVTNINLNTTSLVLNGTIGGFFDSAHAAANKPIRNYSVSMSITATQATGNLQSIIESAAIEKYADLQGGTQS